MPHLTSSQLRCVTDLLADAARTPDRDPTETTVLGIALRDTGLDLVYRPTREHPAEDLLGFRAPPNWEAVVLIMSGALVGSRAGDVVVTHALQRTGTSYTRIDDINSAATTTVDSPAVGRVADVLHRSLGLPTPPAPISEAQVLSVLGLDRLVCAGSGPTRGTFLGAGATTVAGNAR